MKITLFRYTESTWEQARGYLNEDLLLIQTAVNNFTGKTFNGSNQLLGSTIGGDITKVPQYVTNEGVTAQGTPAPQWGLVDLIAGVKKRLQFLHLVQPSVPSLLIGRRSGTPTGDYEEVSLGPGLSMSSSAVLDVAASGGSSRANVLAMVSLRA
jgi:hypothetical protein